ncbi:MAG: hypothetical protein WC859_10420, partial [Elusimicrobiota bacterium]
MRRGFDSLHPLQIYRINMLKKIFAYLEAQSKSQIIGLSISLFIIIFLINNCTPLKISFNAFYLFPTCLVASYVNWCWGFVFALASSAAWILALHSIGLTYEKPVYLLWSFAVRVAYYLMMVFFAITLRKRFLFEHSISRVDPLTNLLNSRGFYE